NADGALELAGSAGGALEDRLLRIVLAQERLLGIRTKFVQVAAHAQNHRLRVEQLAGIRRRAVLGAAAAFHAGVGLEADEACQVLAGDKAKIFVATERRDVRKFAAL